ncbi:hypothetical protein ACFL5H_01260 [Candidatus Latescibacterota bacterium]
MVVVKGDGTDFGFAIGAGVAGRIAPTMKLFLMPLCHSITIEYESTTKVTVHLDVMF